MANKKHIKILKQGVKAWNEWRVNNPNKIPALRNADLRGVNLRDANLIKANLSMAVLSNGDLIHADLRNANLYKASLIDADLSYADLRYANLRYANLHNACLYEAHLANAQLFDATLSQTNLGYADLSYADLSFSNLNYADLTKANLNNAILRNACLECANLDETNLCNSELTNCLIYGVAAWDVKLSNAKQKDLIITSYTSESTIITVDNLEVAQFIYLLLHNEKIRDVIDTITSKVVLILGRFSPERKIILDAIKEGLRENDYAPVLFDFRTPASRDITETIMTLAGISRFVIVDITDARSVPQEIEATVPHLPSVVFQPILKSSETKYGMFEHFERYPWVQPIFYYKNKNDLITNLRRKLIPAVEVKIKEIRRTE